MLVEAGPQGAAGRIGEELEVPGQPFVSPQGARPCRTGVLAAGEAVYLLSGDFERMAALWRFSPKTVATACRRVPYGRGNSARAVLSPEKETQRHKSQKEMLMKRFHVHVSVADLDASIRFYSTYSGRRRRSEERLRQMDARRPAAQLRDLQARGQARRQTISAYRWNPNHELAALRGQARQPRLPRWIRRERTAAMRARTNTGPPIRKESPGKLSTPSTRFRCTARQRADRERACGRC